MQVICIFRRLLGPHRLPKAHRLLMADRIQPWSLKKVNVTQGEICTQEAPGLGRE